MEILASACGTVVHQSGNKLYISKKPAQWTPVFLFVTGLLTVALLVNGVVQLLSGDTGNQARRTVWIFLAIALILALIFRAVYLYQKKIRAIPADALKQVLIINLENNNALDPQHGLLCHIGDAWLERNMQISSSSPELVIRWKSGVRSIVKGNPFSGSITPVENILLENGFRKKA